MRIATVRGIVAVVGFVVAAPSSAAAARGSWRHALARTDTPVCSASYTRGLERAREAHLKEASELFAVCARTACSETTRQECAARRAQLEADTPSLVPLVTDDAGEPRILVEVRIDGALVTSRLDGRALSVDPGKHELSFSTDAGVFATRTLMVVQGERNRAIHVVLHDAKEGGLKPARELAAGRSRAEGRAPEAPPSEATSRDTDERDDSSARPALHASGDVPEVTARRASASTGHGPAPYLFGALGLAGVGGFGLLTYWGRTDNALLAGCAPNCTDASVRHVRQLYWAADASLGVGVLSLAISTWLFASHGSAETTTGPGPVSLDVRPAHAGGVATVVGRF